MSESIPSATADPDAVDQPLPANEEDRKAAAALSSLNTNELAGETKRPSSADQAALGKAMSRLEIASGHRKGGSKASEAHCKEAEIKKKSVKVTAADVNFLVCLDIWMRGLCSVHTDHSPGRPPRLT